MYAAIPLNQIQPDPSQSRRTFPAIEELAQSIALHGLLQNLIVRATTTELSSDGFDRPYTLVAGERRYRALYLLTETVDFIKMEHEEVQTLAEDWPAPCLIMEEHEDIVGLVENIQREDVPIWQLGHKYIELTGAYGLSQDALAAYLGKDPSYVNKAVRIARDLHPDIQSKLNRLGARALTQSRLLSLSRLTTPEGEPNLKAQLARFNHLLYAKRENRGGKRRAPQEMSQRDRVWKRFYNLKSGRTPIPGEYIAIVDALVAYLDGVTPKVEFPE